MARTTSLLIFAFLLTIASASSARADGTFGPNSERSPSVFSYARRGFWTGALVGVGGAYLAARPDGIGGDDWRALVLGSGIGALSGSAIGLTLGFVDLADDQPGRGAIALRDTLYGTGFGLLAGLTTGGIVAVNSHDAEHVLLGGAIGTLTGAGLGLVVGLIEGPRIVESSAHQHRRPQRTTVILSATSDVAGGYVWTPALRGNF